jgi:hypothetical protein
MGGYINGQSSQVYKGTPALNPIGNPIIHSIYDTPEINGTGILGISGELSYTFGKSRTQLHIGNRLEDFLRLDVTFGLGVRQELNDSSIIALTLLHTPTSLKFWSDPFVEDETRVETNLNFPGLRFRWNRILRTPLEFTAVARRYVFANETSGQWLSNEQRISESEKELLNRNGMIYRLMIAYLFEFNGHKLLPSIRYNLDNHQGAAVFNQGYDAKFTYIYFNKKILLDINLAFGQSSAQENHPVYNKIYKTNRYLAGCNLFIPILSFKKSHLNLLIFSEYLLSDANIAFYKSSYSALGLGLLWKARTNSL